MLKTKPHWPSTFAATLALLAGIAALAWGTDGGKAWTAEAARRLAVQENPIPLPTATLISQHTQNTTELLAGSAGPELILMEFIYTRCPTVCLAMGAEFRQRQAQLIADGQQRRVKLLSLSFDPQDTPADLQDYLQRFSAAPEIWSAAIFANAEELEHMKQQLGVIVILEPKLGFIHNAAVYVIKAGKVVAILEHDDRSGINSIIEQFIPPAMPVLSELNKHAQPAHY